jgi:tripartite-type tricarboxylate transporter receptor subunit TctC
MRAAISFAAAIAAFSICLTGVAFAQAYPAKPVRIVVPILKGSGADIAARIVAEHLSQAFRQAVTVENRPGAGGQVGGQVVLGAEPDGYTLLVHSASYAANAASFRNLPYDPLKDFIDVALLGTTPYVMVTAKDGAYPTIGRLIAAARTNPGVIPFASAGVGSSTHLAAEYFALLAGVKMLHIPYRGTPEAIKDTMAGSTAFYMAPINTAVDQIREGKLAALGVTTVGRAVVLPEVPTIAEQGLPKYEFSVWFGMWARSGTPASVVQKLNAQVNASQQSAAVRTQFDKLGIASVPMKPEEFAKFVRDEIATYRRIAAQANIKQQ